MPHSQFAAEGYAANRHDARPSKTHLDMPFAHCGGRGSGSRATLKLEITSRKRNLASGFLRLL